MTEALEAALARLAPQCSVGDVVGRWHLSAAALDARLLTVPLFVSGGGGEKSVKSKSIRPIFGRIDRSRRVLEARPKKPVRTVKI